MEKETELTFDPEKVREALRKDHEEHTVAVNVPQCALPADLLRMKTEDLPGEHND